jgi:hypothetical protein
MTHEVIFLEFLKKEKPLLILSIEWDEQLEHAMATAQEKSRGLSATPEAGLKSHLRSTPSTGTHSEFLPIYEPPSSENTLGAPPELRWSQGSSASSDSTHEPNDRHLSQSSGPQWDPTRFVRSTSQV